MNILRSGVSNGERSLSFAKPLSRDDLDRGSEYTNLKCEDASSFEDLAKLILQARYNLCDYLDDGILESIDYTAVAKIMAEIEFYGCKSPSEFTQTNGLRQAFDDGTYRALMLVGVEHNQKTPQLSFTDYLAKPEYVFVKNYLYGIDEDGFIDDIAVKKLEINYNCFGEIVLVILAKEIDLSALFAKEAIIKLCNDMNSAYYGVFKSAQHLLLNHEHYHSHFDGLPTEYWQCVDVDSLDFLIQNSWVGDARSYRTIEFNGQIYYYCNYMAEALQRISHVGVKFFNIYSI